MNDEHPEIQVGPVVKVARDLSEIMRLSVALEIEAENASNDRLMPGGKATVALASVANLEAFENQVETRERLGLDCRHVLDHDDDWEPPLQTLCFWSEAWRAEHGAEYGQRPTIGSEAAFLKWCLDWAWDNETHWDDFIADIRQARLRLEDLLHDGRRVERTRVPCNNPACDRQPRLIKVYAHAASEDGYKCPACKNRYDQAAYARAKLQHLTEQGADRHVKMQDARDAIGRSDRTFRKWIRFWHVRSYRDDSGQVMVWWPDVRDTELRTQRRSVKASA